MYIYVAYCSAIIHKQSRNIIKTEASTLKRKHKIALTEEES